MNRKGHLFISLGKSAIRVIGGIVTLGMVRLFH